jgi:hypothetical protein
LSSSVLGAGPMLSCRGKVASNKQVRQPVYSDSAGRWKKYGKHLGPLMAALDADSAKYE